MGSWIEELDRRETAARERIDSLRQQIAELTERLAAEESLLSRLEITREMMTEILAGTGEAGEPEPRAEAGGEGEAGAAAASVSPIGVVTVPPWQPGMDAAVLPLAYRDILEILADAVQPLRAKNIAATLGLPADAAKVEGLRSRLKRLVECGWLHEPAPGLFTLARQPLSGGGPGAGG
jgi:hypothetical protein